MLLLSLNTNKEIEIINRVQFCLTTEEVFKNNNIPKNLEDFGIKKNLLYVKNNTEQNDSVFGICIIRIRVNNNMIVNIDVYNNTNIL